MHADGRWETGPCQPVLRPHDVHVWRARLDLSDVRITELERTLSADERERAERFRFAVHRRRFIAGRGLLRAILACYLVFEPADLHFRYGPRGKPALAQADVHLQFNVAHSEGLALLALTSHGQVGVDIERIRRLLMLGVSQRRTSRLASRRS